MARPLLTDACMRGFSLVEVLVACGILATGVLAFAVLLARSIPVNIAAGHTSKATVLAAQKVEELRTASDSTDSVEYIDRSGTVVGVGGDPPRGAIYIRRWTSAPLSGTTVGTRIITVSVAPIVSTRADRVTTIGVGTAP